MKDTLDKAAAKADGRSHRCASCPLHPCSLKMAKMCGDIFIEGFRKGAEWKRKELNKKEK